MIAVAGAGLLGRLIAWQLAVAGHQVTVFEAGSFLLDESQQERAAAYTAAGMIAPLSEAVVSDADVYKMGIFALEQWPKWILQLQNSLPSTQDQPLFFRNGSLVVAHPQDQQELEQFARELQFMLPECNSYQRLTQSDIQQLEPDLQSQFQQGLFLREEGHLHNREFMTLIGQVLQQLNVTIREYTPVSVSPGKVTTNKTDEHFDCVIDCRGFGAKNQLNTQSNPLRGVRGETLLVETNEIHLSRPVRLMHPRYQLYIVPKLHNRFIIGATQIESEDRSPVSLQSSLELSSALYTLAPAFAEARIIAMETNLRPAFMDNLPLVKIESGLITANGLFRHGYLLAPAVVDNVLAHALQQTAPLFSQQLNRN
jgi:glycine oxidase